MGSYEGMSGVSEQTIDVINYCLLMADKLGVDPKEIVLKKLVNIK